MEDTKTQAKIFPNLYFIDSHGNTRFWKLRTEGNKMFTTWGTLGKPSELKPQVSSKIITGKNIGKKNETTSSEQAILVAETKWKQKKKKGYYEKDNEVSGTVHTMMPKRTGTRAKTDEYIEEAIYPMLATKYEKSKRHIKYPIDVQAKFDGMRCTIFMKNDGSTDTDGSQGTSGSQIQMSTRGRKDIPYMTHLYNDLIVIFKKLNKGTVLDGELFCKGKSLQNIISKVRRTKNKHECFDDIKYHIFDIYEPNLVSEKRLLILEGLSKLSLNNINIVKRIEIKNEVELFKQHEQYKFDGHEGTIIRLRDYKYRQGKNNYHCKQLIKLKSHFDDEGIVIDAKQATGNQKGCIVFKLKWKQNKKNNDPIQFWVTPKMTLSERRKLWIQWNADQESIKGRMMTFRYYDLTDDGIPKFANVTGFRDEDL